jgi:hypothetical protein
LKENVKGCEILKENGFLTFNNLRDMVAAAAIWEEIWIVKTFKVVSAEHVTVEGKFVSPEQVGAERRMSSAKLTVRVSPGMIAAGEDSIIV